MTLHDYQKYCVDFICGHPSCALFLDMGLGKTVTTLTAIKKLHDEGEIRKVLVVAPLRVARDTWPAEVEKWEHLEGVTYSTVVGTKPERLKALEKEALVYFINRENVEFLVMIYREQKKRWDFDMVVIDELSSFKSAQAKRFKALRSIRPFVKRWVGLTGTPASNGLLDLWAEMYLLDGGERLGRFISRYRQEYFRPSQFNPQTGIVYKYAALPGAEEQIYKRIDDITVSMKARDFLKMPSLVMADRTVEMSAGERVKYDTLKRDMVLKLDGGDVDAKNAASLAGKLLQIANGRVYDENHEVAAIHDRKLEALEDLVEEANGHPVLVCYWFRHDLSAIMEVSKKWTAQAREIRSSEDIKDWNAGKILLGLIHPASAGHGLNLQAGGHIMAWYGLTWSLELYQQANARLYRQGQEHVVTIHHIICKGTIDEQVIRALMEKDATQERLIAAVKAELGGT